MMQRLSLEDLMKKLEQGEPKLQLDSHEELRVAKRPVVLRTITRGGCILCDDSAGR